MLSEKDQEQILSLIKNLSLTKSTNKTFELISDFCLNPPEGFPISEQVKLDLMGATNAKKKEASARGLEYSKRSVNISKSHSNRSYAHPAFFDKMSESICHCCHAELTGHPGFSWKASKDTWYAYCPTPRCFPNDHYYAMNQNYKYIIWKNQLNTNNAEKI